MTGIRSSVGLVSGIDYTSLVQQLIALDGARRDRLDARTDRLEAQKNALTELTTYFLRTSYLINNLNRADIFTRTEVTSSNTAVLAATRSLNGSALPGSYTFTPLQLASSQQSVAQGVASDSQPLGKSGTISISNGRTLENDIELKNLNGGEGVAKGYVRITDASGTRATIDLRNARTMNDVIKAINDNHDVDVWAELDGDRLILTDMSGGSGTLTVQDVSGGTTAASLGLAGVDADNGVITGNPLYRLGEKLSLDVLNDGNGLVFDTVLGDFSIQCKDGSSVSVDFYRRATTAEIEAGAPEIHRELTLGDLIDTINNSVDAAGVGGKIKASISDDGKRLVLTDLTDGPGTTRLSSDSLNPVLRSLGFTSQDGSASAPISIISEDGTFTSRQLIGELDSVLTSSLNGGYGLAKAVAGAIEVQDRDGNAATLEFTQAELDEMQTLNGAVKLINEKLEDEGIGIKVQINDKQTGLSVIDTTGRTTSNLIFRDLVTTTTTEEPPDWDEDADGPFVPVTTTTDPHIAKSFGLDINQAASSVDGSNLNLQKVSYSTKLSEMNGGKGVTMAGGRITITDSIGRSDTLSINSNTHQTVGDVIRAINSLNVGVIAKISETGDGIMLVDSAGGTGNFSCIDTDNMSRFAKDLRLEQTVTEVGSDGTMRIDGSMTYTVEVVETDTLEDIRQKLNDLGGNFSASIINDGSSAPYRLMITGATTGAGGAMNIDLSCLGLDVQHLSEAKDAILVYGDPAKEGSLVLTSSSNTFRNAIEGIDLTLTGTSATPITVNSARSSTDIKASLQIFVENYNQYQELLNVWTYYDPTVLGGQGAGNLLYNDRVAREFQRDIPDILSKRIHGIPGVTSLRDIGISIRSNLYDTDGTNRETNKLVFDEDKFDALYAENPDAIQDFFFQEQTITDSDGEEITIKTGWAQMFMDVANRLSGDDGIVFREINKLNDQIDRNDRDSDLMTQRLAVKEQQMLKKFYAMEQAMARMSGDMNAISSIATSWAANSNSGSMW